MSWFKIKKYKIVELNDNMYAILTRNGFSLGEWKWYWAYNYNLVYNHKRQAECALYRLETHKDVFTHFCSVEPTNREYVMGNLYKMGYIASCTFDYEEKYIYTSTNGYIYSTNNAKISKNGYDILYGKYCYDNDDLFLAIAAMNDRNDYMQWIYNKQFDFNMNPLPNHKFLCDQETLEKFGFVNNSPNTYKSGIHKKMTIENIIEMFEKNKNKK